MHRLPRTSATALVAKFFLSFSLSPLLPPLVPLPLNLPVWLSTSLSLFHSYSLSCRTLYLFTKTFLLYVTSQCIIYFPTLASIATCCGCLIHYSVAFRWHHREEGMWPSTYVVKVRRLFHQIAVPPIHPFLIGFTPLLALVAMEAAVLGRLAWQPSTQLVTLKTDCRWPQPPFDDWHVHKHEIQQCCGAVEGISR